MRLLASVPHRSLVIACCGLVLGLLVPRVAAAEAPSSSALRLTFAGSFEGGLLVLEHGEALAFAETGLGASARVAYASRYFEVGGSLSYTQWFGSNSDPVPVGFARAGLDLAVHGLVDHAHRLEIGGGLRGGPVLGWASFSSGHTASLDGGFVGAFCVIRHWHAPDQALFVELEAYGLYAASSASGASLGFSGREAYSPDAIGLTGAIRLGLTFGTPRL